MKEMRRVLALVLCFVMLVGMLPAGALAAENETEPVTLVAEAPTDPAGQAQNEDSEGDGQGQSKEPTQQPTEKPADEPTGDAADDAAGDAADDAAGDAADDAAGDADGDAAGDADGDAAGEAPEAGEQDPTDAAPTEAPSEPKEIAVTGITLDRTELEVGVAELPIQLVATVLPEDATDKTVTWKSSEPGVASVDKNGLLTIGYMGEAVITAKAGEFTAECKVTVGEGESDDYALEYPVYVLAGSDFQARSGHDAGATIVSGLLDKIKVDYPTMDGFLFAGDYYVNYNDSANGQLKLQKTVQAVYGTSMDEIYVQGNHDSDVLVGSNCTKSGANDAEGYGVFVINEKDYMWYNNDEATIKKTAENLETYLNAKRNAGYTKPIFVISHLPLHYCMRTRSGGNDGMHANYIFDVLNEAGNAGLNIIFMFGHNHSHGWDDYLGGAAIFLTRGNKINIAQNSTTVFQEETLAFTYMNAGYVGYYGDSYTSSVDKTLTMTTFAITDNDVTISRYDSNGTHNLKSAGVYNVEYPDSAYYSTDTTTVGTPYTLTLNKEITPAGEEITPPDSGDTTDERTYTRVTSTSDLVSGGQYLIIENGSTDYFMLPESISNDSGDRVGYNIEATSVAGGDTITGDYSDKEWTMTGSGTSWVLSTSAGSAYLEYQSSSRAYGRISSTNSSTFTIGGSADAFTFSTRTNNTNYVFDHSSAGMINGYVKTPETLFYIYRLTNEGSSGGTVTPEGGDWITITEPTTAGTKYVYELDTDGVDTGVEYLIVANSYPKALSAAASSNNAVAVEISGNYAYADSDTYGWTFTQQYSGYNNGVYYIRLNNSAYLTLSDNALSSSNSTGSSRRWTVASNNNSSYDITQSVSSGYWNTTTYNLRWSNSNGVFQASNSNEGPVRLYKYVKTETTTAQSGLYGKLEGELTYNVAIGTSKDDALAAVKAGIDILYHTGDESAAQTFPDDGEGMTWTLDESYDGTTAGEYAVTIAYNGVTLGTAKVVVPTVNITGYTVEPAEGTVNKGASQTAETGALIYVQLENGKYYTVPVTVSMLTKADGSAVSTGTAGEIEKLTLTYNGVKITESFTLNVVAQSSGVSGNNYPEYPNEGAVKVSKTGTGIDFQSSGIAQVEVSASGVPMKKGADVIVMLDLSSSMNDNKVTVNGVEKTRLQVLRESLTVLLKQLQKDDAEGNPMDIRIAVADFNRYYTDSSSPYYINSKDTVAGGSIRTNNSGTNKVYTGTRNIASGAFVDVHSIEENAFQTTNSNNQYYLGYQSGTNYDYAFDAIYQLGEAVTAQNATNGEERDLFVIFMSDGAPFQFNYFSSQSSGTGAAEWNNWLTGTLDLADIDDGADASYYNEDGKHWMAEAIKADPSGVKPVIRKNNAADTDGDTWVDVQGLGAKMYSIGFCLAKDKEITVASMDAVIRNIATSDQYYFRANSAADLDNAFSAIGNDIAYAAYNARFVDQMGDDYNLQLKTEKYEVVENGTTTEKTLAPVIEILSYDIYTRAEADAGDIPEGKNIGDRKGTYALKEVVKFSEDGSKAYSNLIDVDKDGTYGVTVNSDGTYTISDADDNILGDNGVIYATTFLYNKTSAGIAIDGVKIPTGKNTANLTTGSTNVLPAETFYWNMGTVQTSELAMRYYVYLDGSMEGTRPGGSYPTNEYATLYYDNYLGNPCYKETVSPVMAWKEANVSYAFYLVDENGNIIVNQTTGQTGTFANKIAVTNPVVYETVLLNNEGNIQAIKVADVENNILPLGYELYDDGAEYEVTIMSNTTGKWEITNGGKPVNTTYVTQYKTDDASAYSNALTNNTIGNDYTHTVVWFAVLWKVQALPDSVVIDYGLPVDISVLTNDMFGENGKLAGVGAISETLNLDGHDTDLAAGFGETYTGTYGEAKADASTGKVRYTLNTSNGMQMQTYEKFAYAVNYTGTTNSGYYYDTVTVIPATTIYYEDEFLTYEYHYSGEGTLGPGWVDEGTAIEGATQAEDRPGQFSLTDANNIYGYDAVNNGMSTFSLGTAKKVHVDADSYATAAFTFYGTGFDVISMTSNTTGTLAIKVTAAEDIVVNGTTKYTAGDKVKSAMVNTYYGYNYVDGKWVATPNTENALYQVPVMQIEELPYGKYDVVITATYAASVDKTTDDGYDLYLDAIRIYDPANDGAADDDDVIENAYVKDHEGWPSYIELRNNIIAAEDGFGKNDTDTEVIGMVFIDGDAEVGNDQMADYKSYGPNNEVYLAAGQSVAFMISDAKPSDKSIVDQIHIGMKSANSEACTYKIFNIAKADSENNVVAAGQKYHEKTAEISTATDMYYDITGYRNDIVVIQNTGSSGILSLTNIKTTYTVDPNAAASGSASNGEDAAAAAQTVETEPVVTYLYMTKAAATLTVDALNGKFDEDTTPEVTEPEATEPEATEPEVTEPEATEPEATEPEVTEPEATEPEVTEPEVTEPEETEPEETEPEAFEPEISVKLSKSSVRVGQKVQVKVTTSRDVAYLTVNGETLTRYSTNRRTGERTWSTNVTAKEAGSMSITVTAYSDSDIAAEPVVKTVNVTKKASSLLGSILEWIFG